MQAMSESPIRAIIFDLGGVLLDWNPRHLYRRFFESDTAVEAFLSEIGFAEWNLQQDRGRPFEQVVAELSSRFPQYAALIRVYKDSWECSLAGAIPGSIQILRRLRDAGYSIYGLSNWSAETFPVAQARFDFLALFDDIVISGAVGMAKPEPGIFKLLLQRIGRPAKECLFIDDGIGNVTAARELGLTSIHFTGPEQLGRELRGMHVLGGREEAEWA